LPARAKLFSEVWPAGAKLFSEVWPAAAKLFSEVWLILSENIMFMPKSFPFDQTGRFFGRRLG
jgi:hypothetical protein